MRTIVNINGNTFSLDGISFKKVFVAIPVGASKIRIVCAYDSKFQILDPTPYDEVEVNGLTFGSQSALIAYLVDVIFIRGEAGPAGNDGLGVPAGGDTLQVLQKASSADNDTQWATIKGVPVGGTNGQVLRKNSGADYDFSWATPAQGTNYRGNWDADEGLTPNDGDPVNAGDFWIVDVAGSTNLNGITTWENRDWAIWNGTIWQRVPGAVVLIYVGIDSAADNLSASASTAKYIWDALQSYITSNNNNIGNLQTSQSNITSRVEELEKRLHTYIGGNFFELRKMPGNTNPTPEEGDLALNGWISSTDFGKILSFTGGDSSDFENWNILESI